MTVDCWVMCCYWVSWGQNNFKYFSLTTKLPAYTKTKNHPITYKHITWKLYRCVYIVQIWCVCVCIGYVCTAYYINIYVYIHNYYNNMGVGMLRMNLEREFIARVLCILFRSMHGFDLSMTENPIVRNEYCIRCYFHLVLPLIWSWKTKLLTYFL